MVSALKRHGAVAVVAVSLAVSGIAIPSAAADGGVSLVRNQRSGKCLEVSTGSLAKGTKAVQWTCTGNQHQLWRVIDLNNGYVQLQVEHSGQCLEVDNASLASGAGVLQWPCHGGVQQQWKKIAVGGSFQFKARHSSQCLEVDQATGGLANGDRVLQWPCHGGPQQLWRLG
ncbi:RICIN domain-containing protein [Streptomyces sp. NPDC060053]|uniref:RICIN domain-containing protein n=1 Tax=Streptomyces sp. NPDC060053 TaxID=3347047 RepID=UPI0036BBB371